MAEQPGTFLPLLDDDTTEDVENSSLELGEESPESEAHAQDRSGTDDGVPAGSELISRIQELESKSERYLQQLAGSAAEARRLKDDMARVKTINEQLQKNIETVQAREAETLALIRQQQGKQTQTATEAAPKRVTMREAIDKATIDGDYSLMEAYERQEAEDKQRLARLLSDRGQSKALTEDDVRRISSEGTARVEEQRTRKQLMMQSLATNHPEFSNKDFSSKVLDVHDALMDQPATRQMVPKDADAEIDVGGKLCDMRVLDRAAWILKTRMAVEHQETAKREAEETKRKEAPTLDSGTANTAGRGKAPSALFTRAEMDNLRAVHGSMAGSAGTFEEFVKNRWETKKKTNPEQVAERVKTYKAGKWNAG